MIDHRFEVIGLDKDFNVVKIFDYVNLQWSRRFFSSGQFSMQIPFQQYDPSVKFLYTKDRPELGEVSQINYIVQNHIPYVYISGYFLEERMNRRVVYAKGAYSNITSDPGWVVQEGKAEDVARAYFNAFKDISYEVDGVEYTSELGVTIEEESQHRGNNSVRHRLNDYLGNKMYSILKPRRMSPRFVYDFETSKITLHIYQGRDLTQGNRDGNNPVIFSTEFDNLRDPNILLSDTDYKNCFIVSQVAQTKESEEELIYTFAGNDTKETDTSDRFCAIETSLNRDDFSSQSDFITAMIEEGHSELLNRGMKLSVDFNVIEGSIEYMKDFDLGDECSLEVPEFHLSSEAILTGCYEVIKGGVWSMSMEFNTPNKDTEID